MAEVIRPEYITHIYPIVASDTERLAHTGVPKSVTPSSYTKQLQMDVIRNPTAVGKCISTLDNETLEEVRMTSEGVLVAGSYDIIQTVGVQQQGIGASYKSRVGLKSSTAGGERIWKLKVKLQKLGSPTGTGYIRIRKVLDNSSVAVVSFDVSTISSTATWYEFVFTSRPSLTYAYRVLVEYDGGDAANYIRTVYRNADVESWSIYNDYPGWVEYLTYDFVFEIMFLPIGYGKIYKNGSPIGSEFDTSPGVLGEDLDLSDDLGPFTTDDSIELWGKIDNSNPGGTGNHTMQIDNYKAKYDWDSTKIKGAASYS